VSGMIKLVLYDPRSNSPTYREVKELSIGERNPILVKIPPLVYHGFKGIGTRIALIINTITDPYNYQQPDEFRVRWDSSDIPYDWFLKNE
jgi:dTDP-4-dehydrorhamnose 3,5-epimerase